MAETQQNPFQGRPMPKRAFPQRPAREGQKVTAVGVEPRVGPSVEPGTTTGVTTGAAPVAGGAGSGGGSAFAVLLPSESGGRASGAGRVTRPRAAPLRAVEGAAGVAQPGPVEGVACLKCRDRQYVLVAQGEHVQARVCDCRVGCTLCGARGYVIRRAPNGYLYYEDCTCRSFVRRLERFNQAQVPAHFARCDLSSFENTRHNSGVLQRAMDYATRFTPGQPEGLLLYGDPGVGKSHLAVGILKVLVFEKDVQCLFKDFFLLLSEVRNAYNEGRFDSELLRPLTEVEVLIIDELGKGRSNSDWEQALLDEIICRRYNQLKTTLFTTNFPLPDDQELPGRTQGRAQGNLSSQLERPNLEERIGDRMFSRLKQMCSMLKVTGQDYRKTHTINSLQGRKL